MKQMKIEKIELNCRLILPALLCLLLPMLTACDGLIDGLGNKKKSAVNFSLSNVAPWSAETLLRSASETPRVVETACASLPDNWVLEASLVEEPVAPTRAASNLAENTIVRIIARKSSDNTVAAEANYKCDASGQIVPDTDPMELDPGSSYYFMAYSYNNPSDDAPVNAIGTVSFTPYSSATEHDLILSTTGSVSINGNVNLGSLTHQFSRVRYSEVIVDAPTQFEITGVELTPNYTAKLTKSDGKLAMDLQTDARPLSKTDFRLVYTDKTLPVLKISGKLNDVPFDNVPLSYKKPLAANTSYILQINLRKGLTWAGSNIYWDAANSRLTFAKTSVPDSTYYQGVFFRNTSITTNYNTWGVGKPVRCVLQH
jgi:hypothetical protein